MCTGTHARSVAATGRWCGIARFGFRASMVVLAFGTFATLNLTEALADEFEVAIVISPTADGAEASDFLNGFQLAVDQSPDVSHPPNTEGGDHLGSMDVVFAVVDNLTDPVQVAGAMTDLDGAPILVADVSAEVLTVIVGPSEEANVFVIATRGFFDTGRSLLPQFGVEVDHLSTDVLLTDRVPGFSDAYATAHGEAPSEAATRGYIAGRMVDIAVEATDRDPFDRTSLSQGINDVVGQPGISEPESPPATVLSARDTPTASPGRDVTAILLWVAILFVVLAAGVVMVRRMLIAGKL
ncbi:MAG: hypothetical protein M3132_09595 [Actinomycetia bacterium]|nr:hypothetical protein [Actinomycetes bacterium]